MGLGNAVMGFAPSGATVSTTSSGMPQPIPTTNNIYIAAGLPNGSAIQVAIPGQSTTTIIVDGTAPPQ